MDITKHNSLAWDNHVEQKNQWTIPVSRSHIETAKAGRWQLFITPNKAVPKTWIPQVKKCNILCLASGGGQQGPILAAAGANVTVLDNSEKQLQQDRYVAERDSLSLETIKADMRDLSGFNRESFDFIIQPVSNLYIPELEKLWKESYRVLKYGGKLLSSFMNPTFYLFDQNLIDKKGILKVKYALPYSDYKHLSLQEKEKYIAEKVPFEFSHTLESQIGGQLEAGFVITGFYEDRFNKYDRDTLSEYMATFIVTCAEKNA